ncbi:hypothetical protein D307_gp075 [Bacillus phage Bastille]|uniref:Uncharacterized protein n=2 Tax=Bastillevirus TaxID=1918010 RepID=J9PKN4_9CAUD|nr:hypothetical protein D307_gp075 [Bacillus phage Bastille]AEQ34389.1 hypothetical protein [Bacillus phage Bastille]ASU01109.1 hypothetical protein ANTHONY_269 [Bacillus phage Anthony]
MEVITRGSENLDEKKSLVVIGTRNTYIVVKENDGYKRPFRALVIPSKRGENPFICKTSNADLQIVLDYIKTTFNEVELRLVDTADFSLVERGASFK